jgi:hypothetical protein
MPCGWWERRGSRPRNHAGEHHEASWKPCPENKEETADLDSVADPRHFDVDPDPRIHASD